YDISSLLIGVLHYNTHHPSFPTRRSSDLFQSRNADHLSRWIVGNSAIIRHHRYGPARGRDLRQRRKSDLFGLFPFQPGGRLGDRDRKSTRLNSSHEWISYAVFCLKKKNPF